MKLVYICGPITGIENNNKEAFSKAKIELMDRGIIGINPLDYTTDSMPWGDCMRIVIPKMLECSGIALLDGWRKSEGCGLEVVIAEHLGMEIKTLHAWIEKYSVKINKQKYEQLSFPLWGASC